MESWVPVVFIVLAIAMAVGPVMMLKPSKYQQRLASLRAKALERGLRVHMMPLQGADDLVPAYCRPWVEKDADRRPWVLLRTRYAHEINFSGAWAWQSEMQAPVEWHGKIKRQLDAAPAQLLAIGNGPQGLSCYWDERGGEQVLVALGEMLDRLSR